MATFASAARSRLLVIGVVGALATIPAFLPGSWLCALDPAPDGAECGTLDVVEWGGGIVLMAFGFGGALLVGSQEREVEH